MADASLEKTADKLLFLAFGMQFCALGCCVGVTYSQADSSFGAGIGAGIGSSTGLFFGAFGPLCSAISKIKLSLSSSYSADKIKEAAKALGQAQSYMAVGVMVSFLSVCLAGVITAVLCDRPLDPFTGPVSECDGKAAGLGFFAGTGPFFSGLIAVMNGITRYKTACMEKTAGEGKASEPKWPPRNDGCSGGADSFVCCRACCCPCFVIEEIAKKEEFPGADGICLRTGIWWSIVWIFGPAWWWLPTIGQNVGWWWAGPSLHESFEPWVVFLPHAFCAIWQILYVLTIMQQHNRIAAKYNLPPIKGCNLLLMFWVIFASWGLTLIQQWKVVGLGQGYQRIKQGVVNEVIGEAVEVANAAVAEAEVVGAEIKDSQ